MLKADKRLVRVDNSIALERRMEEGMNVDAVDEDGWTLLHFAAAEGSVKCLRVLVQRGADVTKEEVRKWTPLHYAAAWGHAKCVKVCVENESFLWIYVWC